VVSAHSFRDDCWSSKHHLYKSPMGNQNTLHGAVYTLRPRPQSFLPRAHRQTQSRTEIRYRHTLDAAMTIYRSEGASAFYRGLVPSLLGIAHVAVQFPLYEQLKLWAREFLPFFPVV
jgi:hypothetical protein